MPSDPHASAASTHRVPVVLPLRCHCGSVAGRAVDAADVFRIVCLCRSCQAYARFLGRPDDLLDAAGGTDIYQLTAAQLRLDTGVERLACVRLTRHGPLRWYAGCCRTPVANLLAPAWVPWVGVPHAFVDGHRAGDDAYGPVRHRINARHATRPVPGAHPSGPPALVVQTLWKTVRDVLRGRARPSPFRDARGRPLVEPTMLDEGSQ